MPLPVSLHDVVQEMDTLNDEWQAYIHRKTGELFTITGEDDEAVVPAEVLEAIESGSEDYLALPSEFDLDEYAIMERFVESIEDDTAAEGLAVAIQGKGAFRRFKDTLHRHGIQDRWYAFRD